MEKHSKIWMYVAASFLVLMMSVLLMHGCGVFENIGNTLDTPEKKYVAARAELNLLIKQYLDIQDSVPDEEHKVIKQALYDADKALDIWEIFLQTPNYDYSQNIKVFLEAKSIIIKHLTED